jgi:PadR family transcriptional regulator
MGNLYRFVEPLVLLELARTPGASGYGLLERLASHSLTGTVIDKAAVYRTLKMLECQGMAEVEWTDSARGAGRKAYRLTAAGREHLEEWRGLLQGLANGLEEFCREAGQLP